jgi:hypothetical protein
MELSGQQIPPSNCGAKPLSAIFGLSPDEGLLFRQHIIAVDKIKLV